MIDLPYIDLPYKNGKKRELLKQNDKRNVNSGRKKHG